MFYFFFVQTNNRPILAILHYLQFIYFVFNQICTCFDSLGTTGMSKIMGLVLCSPQHLDSKHWIDWKLSKICDRLNRIVCFVANNDALKMVISVLGNYKLLLDLNNRSHIDSFMSIDTLYSIWILIAVLRIS